jgi:hypothetical protein
MASAQSPVDVNAGRAAENGPGRLAACTPSCSFLGPANWWLPRWIGQATPSLAIEPNVDHRVAGGLACTSWRR